MGIPNRVPRPRRGWAAVAICIALGLALDAQQTDDVVALSKLTTVLAELALTSAAQSSTSNRPLSIDTLPKSAQDAVRARRLRINDSNEVQVYVLAAQVNDDVVRQLTASGATVEIADPARRRIQARVPVSKLLAIARLSFVNAIRLPTYARRRTGSVDSEGDQIMRAMAARTDFGLDGTGIRVGVISDGLKGVFATGCTSCAGVTDGPISKGDLPTAAGIRSSSGVLTSSTGGIVGRSFQANGDMEGLPPPSPVCKFAGAGGEGTALLEIVHDLAPGAKLSFANGGTDLEFEQAVNFLTAANDIVLDDIGFFGEPYDGTSGVSSNTAAALNNPANPVRVYFTAVGNDADDHYYGAFTDSGVDGTTVSGITTSGHLHLFQRTSDTSDALGLGAQPYDVISLPQNGEVAIFLTWDDPFGRSANNYDLYLVQQSTGRVVAHSTDLQSGSQDPVEVIDYVNTGPQDRFHIVVQNVQNAAKAKNLNIFSFQPECAAAGPQVLAPPRHDRHNYNTPSRSISAQGDAAGSPVGVIAVGAICSASANAANQFSSGVPDESCLDTSNSTPEFFSSRGPTLDGRTKPDIAAIDGVSITGAGSFTTPFFGTSAAAPHMGGLAALFLQAAPCLLNRAASTIDPVTARKTVHDAILRSAVALSGLPGNTVGSGLADAYAAVQSTLPSVPTNTALTVDGNVLFGATLTPSQLGFTDPNHCDLKTLSWTGGCGTGPGPTMTCAVGTNAVSVSASNNGVAFSGTAIFQIVVTSFSIATLPASTAIPAGQNARFTVSLAPQGGPFNTPITLACSNLPAQAACTFDPPTVTLGSASAQSTLTISTGGAMAPASPSERWRWPISGNVNWQAYRPAGALLLGLTAAFAALLGVRRRFGLGAARWAAAAITFACAIGGPPTRVSAPPLSASMASGIAVFPATVTYGSQTVGTVAPPVVVSVTNIGADALTFSGIQNTGDFSFTTTCGASLDAGGSCVIGVRFAPTATGARTGTLTITDNAAGSPHTVSLQGTGVAVPTSSGPTPTGSYSITISATAGTFVGSGVVVLSVQ